MLSETGIKGVTHQADGTPIMQVPVAIKVSIGRPAGWNGRNAPGKLFRFVFQRRNKDGKWDDDPELMKKMTEEHGKKYDGSKDKLWVRQFPATLIGGRVDQVLVSKGMFFDKNRLGCSTQGFVYYRNSIAEHLGIADPDEVTFETLEDIAKKGKDGSSKAKQILKDIDTVAGGADATKDSVLSTWAATRVSDDNVRRPFPCMSYDCPWHKGGAGVDRTCSFIGEFYFRLTDVFEDGIAMFRTSSPEIIRNLQDALIDAQNMTDILAGVDVMVKGEVKRKQFGPEAKTTKVFNVSAVLPGKSYTQMVTGARSAGESLKEAMGKPAYAEYVKNMRATVVDFDHGVSEDVLRQEIIDEFTHTPLAPPPPKVVGEKTEKKAALPEPAADDGIEEGKIESAMPSDDAVAKSGSQDSGTEDEGEEAPHVDIAKVLGIEPDSIAERTKNLDAEKFQTLIDDVAVLPGKKKLKLIERIISENPIAVETYDSARSWVTDQLHSE